MVKMTMTVGSSPAARSASNARRDSLSSRPSARNNSSAWSIATTKAGGRSDSSPATRRAAAAWTSSASSGRKAPAPACAAARRSARESRRQDCGERVDEAGLAGQRRALGTDHRQGNELRVVAVRASAGARRAGTTTCPRPRRRGSPSIAAALPARSPRSRSMASTIGASRPKKMPASSASCGFKPR